MARIVSKIKEIILNLRSYCVSSNYIYIYMYIYVQITYLKKYLDYNYKLKII